VTTVSWKAVSAGGCVATDLIFADHKGNNPREIQLALRLRFDVREIE
jgi:hypothetical protein